MSRRRAAEVSSCQVVHVGAIFFDTCGHTLRWAQEMELKTVRMHMSEKVINCAGTATGLGL